MTTTLRTLLSELDRPDLPDAAKQVVQLEIEKLLGRNAREILRVKGKETCRWTYDEDTCSWDTVCGHKIQFTCDGPKQNCYKFCPGCGNLINALEELIVENCTDPD